MIDGSGDDSRMGECAYITKYNFTEESHEEEKKMFQLSELTRMYYGGLKQISEIY